MTDVTKRTSAEMTNVDLETIFNEMPVEQWLAIRKEAALKIDPQTAEVTWKHGYGADPYGVYSDLTEQEEQIGRNYFARSPGSDIWVSFNDLPDHIHTAVWKKYEDEEDDKIPWLMSDSDE